MGPVLRIDLRLPVTSDWIRVFDARDGTLFVARPQPLAVTTAVRIDLVVGESGPRVILRGHVIETRQDPGHTGSIVAFGPNERVKLNYLNGYVRGGLLDLRERRRLPLRLPVTYGAVEGARQTHTRDINDQGVFVVSTDPLPEDSEVHLLITFPGRPQPLSLSGTVSHTVVPEDEDVPGMGIVFDARTAEAADLAGAVDALEKAFLGNELPDELLE
jgi:hypothetical protein